MSEPTAIDAETFEVTHGAAEVNLFDRVAKLEQQVVSLLQGHKNVLEHFQEMVVAITEVANAATAATEEEEEVSETIMDLSLVPSEE